MNIILAQLHSWSYLKTFKHLESWASSWHNDWHSCRLFFAPTLQQCFISDMHLNVFGNLSGKCNWLNLLFICTTSVTFCCFVFQHVQSVFSSIWTHLFPTNQMTAISQLIYGHHAILNKWATSWQNLFLPYVNNKGAHQPAHPCSMVSHFVVHCLDSIRPLLAKSKISGP